MATRSGCELLATYRADGLRRMLTGVYETLRSAGRDLVLELGERPALAEAIAAFREEAASLAADESATASQRASATEALRTVTDSAAARVVDLSALHARGVRAGSYELTRKAVERSALEELAAHDRDLLQDLLERFADEYAAAKRRESAVDFEDLQLAARDLLRDSQEVRDAVRLRFRLLMVDEFQDTNALQCEIVDLVAHPELTEVFTVGDEFQSIYGFRHADVEVFRKPPCSSLEPAHAPLELPLAPAGARGRELPLRGCFRRRVSAPGGVGGVRRPGLRASRRAHGHRQGELPRLGRALAPRRGSGDCGARARARRLGSGASGRDRRSLRRRDGRRALRGGAPAGGASDLPRDRARLLRAAAGCRPSGVSEASAQPLRRRRARHRPRVAAGGDLQRLPRPDPPERDPATALHGARAWPAREPRRRGREAAARVSPTLRPARLGIGSGRSRTTVRARPRRARLRPGGARPLGRLAPVREPAEARAGSPASTRRSVATTFRASFGSFASRTLSVQGSSRRSRRKKERTPCDC